MLGTDIVKIDRIEKIYKKYGNAFLDKIFTEKEKDYIKKKNYNIETIAGLFAAKEAISKANGTGFSQLSFQDINILHNIKNRPCGIIRDRKFALSISHEKEYAIAIAKYVYNESKMDIHEIGDMPKFLKVLERRMPNTHKGDYGKVGIIAGSIGMTGSCYLASNAALRCGSGLVYNIVPKEIMDIMSIKYIEVIAKTFNNNSEFMEFSKKLDAIAIGPGMGKGDEQFEILKNIIKYPKNIVIDADGLNNLSEKPDILKERKKFTTILTPHNAEFSRLSGKKISEIEKNRKTIAKDFAKKYNVILVLKGNRTIVTDGKNTYINKSGNPGMATAGSGDVLTGIIVSLLGRGIDVFSAAAAGVYLHGLAGDKAAEILGEESVIASDIIDNIGKVVENLYK